MIIILDNETHPQAEIMQINIANSTVDFKNSDGLCNCSYMAEGDIPTEAELKIAIEAVLGE